MLKGPFHSDEGNAMSFFSKILDKLGFNQDEHTRPTDRPVSPDYVPPVVDPGVPPVVDPPLPHEPGVPPYQPDPMPNPIPEHNPSPLPGHDPMPGQSPNLGTGYNPSSFGNSTSLVDVTAQLESLASTHPESLNWRTSIVDLLKLLGLDSSLEARRELAVELGCPGNMLDDSTQMNIWLHRTVMKKLAENGGNLPPELL